MAKGGLMVLARRAWRTRQKNGPGLLFILVALVVVAAAGARYFGLYTPEQPTLAPQWMATKIEGSAVGRGRDQQKNSGTGYGVGAACPFQ